MPIIEPTSLTKKYGDRTAVDARLEVLVRHAATRARAGHLVQVDAPFARASPRTTWNRQGWIAPWSGARSAVDRNNASCSGSGAGSTRIFGGTEVRVFKISIKSNFLVSLCVFL